jgi:uncharacterized membrane protein (UPF0182 family)
VDHERNSRVNPIENSFLYVVPLYLKAEGTNFPQLKRVIVATGDKVVMEPTLDEALGSLFGTAPVQSGPLMKHSPRYLGRHRDSLTHCPEK